MELPLREAVNLKCNMHRDSGLCLGHAKVSVNIGGGVGVGTQVIVTEAE